jgi:hypothetical protein
MRRPRRAGVATEDMVARERGAGGVDGEDAGARRLRRSRQWERKGAGRARSRRKAAARETGGDKIGRRVDAIFSGSLQADDPATSDKSTIKYTNHAHCPTQNK